MAKAEIYPGNCGFTTTVEVTKDGKVCRIAIQSECPAIQKLAEELTEVNPYQEISFRKGIPPILQAGINHCTHAACPIPVGIVKAVELEAGMTLPTEVTIKLTKS